MQESVVGKRVHLATRSCDLPSPDSGEMGKSFVQTRGSRLCPPQDPGCRVAQSHLELVQVGMLWAPGILEPHEVRGALVELRQQHLQGKGSTSGSCPFLALQLPQLPGGSRFHVTTVQACPGSGLASQEVTPMIPQG